MKRIASSSRSRSRQEADYAKIRSRVNTVTMPTQDPCHRINAPGAHAPHSASAHNSASVRSSAEEFFENAPRQETTMHVPEFRQFVHPTPSLNDARYAQSKKGHIVEYYFRDCRFSGAPEQSVDILIRDYEICAVQQCLDPTQMSLFFVSALSDPAQQFFLTHCSSRMPFDQIVTHIRRHFNSESRKLSLLSDMDSLNLVTFMKKYEISNHSLGLKKIIDHINALAPQLPRGFGDNAHKTRYLRRAVMRFPWAQNPIAQLTTSQYTFVHVVILVSGSLLLRVLRPQILKWLRAGTVDMSNARAGDIVRFS